MNSKILSYILKRNYINAKNNTPRFYVYILKCDDDKHYTGYSEQLAYRYMQHKQDLGARFTKGKNVKLVYFEAHATREEALKREKEIKRAGRNYRNQLITRFALLMSVLKEDLF